MLSRIRILVLMMTFLFVAACATAYKAQPLPFRAPSSYANAVEVGGTTVAAEAFADPKKAKEAFGFDVRGAGMLPVEVVFDNEGAHSFKIDDRQTFLEDEKGNLWPILDEKTAYDRATKYAQTKEIVKEGAYSGLLGAAAGAIIGSAIGIVSGGKVGETLGRGAAAGAAVGATLGGVKGYSQADEARRTIINDLNKKSLENKPIPRGLAYGFLFFPGEAQSAKLLRLQLVETDTGKVYVLRLNLGAGGTENKASVPAPSVVEVYPGSPGNAPAAPAGLTPPPPVAPPSAVPPPPPVPPASGYSGGPAVPPPGDQTTCRERKMIGQRMEHQYDPSTGTYRDVPVEKWDWVEVPCNNEAGAGVESDVNVVPPPGYVFPDPPEVAVIPGTYVYVVPDINVDILFYHGYWYRPYGGRWYWARFYNGPWVYLAPGRVPRVLLELPPGYRRLPPGYHHIPYGHLQANWERWERERYWHGDREWREHDWRRRHEGGRD
jgi:hypothetical protein